MINSSNCLQQPGEMRAPASLDKETSYESQCLFGFIDGKITTIRHGNQCVFEFHPAPRL
jgi:hypothetical protein